MAASSSNAVRRVDVSPGLSGVGRIKLLLLASGFAGVAAFARAADEREQEVWQAITARRRNATTERILDKLAAAVDRPRATIDSLVAQSAKNEGDDV